MVIQGSAANSRQGQTSKNDHSSAQISEFDERVKKNLRPFGSLQWAQNKLTLKSLLPNRLKIII